MFRSRIAAFDIGYAHLGATRHRSDVVEYRVAQHLELLSHRLGRLGFVTGNVTEIEAGKQVSEWARRDSNARPLAPERRPDCQPPPDGADSPS
jgi:hypothetical protein